MKHHLKQVLASLIITVLSTTVVFADTKIRKTTYSMSAGVYSKSMNIKKKGKLKVGMQPNCVRSYDCPIDIYVDQKRWYGWGGADISSKSVNSHEFKKVTFTTKEKDTYRVYLSSPYRYHVEGTVTFTWDTP